MRRFLGEGPRLALDREAKVRVMAYAKAWNARHRQPGQHVEATGEVLEAMLWGSHNARTGACFPSYEAIAAKAECCRDTVCEAIHALERCGALTWVNRSVREQVRERNLFGRWVSHWRVVRTSNAYRFHDPKPGAAAPIRAKTENPAGTLNQKIPSFIVPRRTLWAPSEVCY